MAQPREIRRRIKSIRNTQQITRAMKMVAAAKLRKVLDRTIQLRPYTDAITELREHLVNGGAGQFIRSVGEREPVGVTGVLFFAGDRGLCGSYNINLTKELDRFLASKPDEKFLVYTCGRKGKDYLLRKSPHRSRCEHWGHKDEIVNAASFALALELTREAIKAWESGRIDTLYVVYSQFINALSQKTAAVRLWPPDLTATEVRDEDESDYIFEPDAESLIRPILERQVSTMVFSAMLESASSEYAARMTAMENATKNADDLVSALTLEYNKARQQAITDELLDIVGGANAMLASR